MGNDDLILEVTRAGETYRATYKEGMGVFGSGNQHCREAILGALNLARDEFGFVGEPKNWFGRNDKINLYADTPQTDMDARQALRQLELCTVLDNFQPIPPVKVVTPAGRRFLS